MKRTAEAFAPAGISSFFEICDQSSDGKPLVDLARVGARGGGFGLEKGVLTQVSISEAKANRVRVYINGRLAPEAETTKTVVRMLLTAAEGTFNVTVRHRVEVPIGAGFGTSAGGALTAGLALSTALGLPLTFNQIGKVAHVAEVQCKTGLGTVGPLMVSGCVLTLEPGAPGVSVIDRIPMSPDYLVVAGVYGPTPTKQVLSSAEKRNAVNRCGKKTLDAIMAEPTLENFLSSCWAFAEEAGFATPRVKRLVELARKAGAVGAAQNMVGEAVHAVVLKENAAKVEEAFKQALPHRDVVVSRIDFQGARLVSKT
ncbi:MAG: pantoate kinase [Candidatus Bathyarchaeia archaeon]